MTSQSTSPVSSNGSKDKPWLEITLAVVVVTFLVISRPSYAEWYGESQAHMGTEISVFLWHDDPRRGEDAVAAIFSEVARLDQLMSTYIEDSEISAINRQAAAMPVEAGVELFDLIQRSLDISILTLGAFDITYDSVGQHYDFREGAQAGRRTRSPTSLQSIDYRLVRTDRSQQDGPLRTPKVCASTWAVSQKAMPWNVASTSPGNMASRHARVTAGGDTRLLGDRQGSALDGRSARSTRRKQGGGHDTAGRRSHLNLRRLRAILRRRRRALPPHHRALHRGAGRRSPLRNHYGPGRRPDRRACQPRYSSWASTRDCG